jgi:transcriptional regulator with XRE-family HTH domain
MAPLLSSSPYEFSLNLGGNYMSKRNKIIKVSTESAALKELRENEGLSLRKLAELMDLSFMRVHQMESGRENISEEYVRKFLKATGYSWEDWNKKTASINPHDALRIKCHEALDSIEPSKLQLMYGLLTSI